MTNIQINEEDFESKDKIIKYMNEMMINSVNINGYIYYKVNKEWVKKNGENVQKTYLIRQKKLKLKKKPCNVEQIDYRKNIMKILKKLNNEQNKDIFKHLRSKI